MAATRSFSVGNPSEYFRNNFMFWILPVSLACLLYLLCTQHIGDLFFSSEWFIDLMVLPNFFGAQMSGISYIGRTMDHAGTSGTNWWERVGTRVGLGLGLAIGIALAVLKTVTPFVHPLGVVGDILFTLGTVGAFSGLGNRLGQFIDKGGRPASEKKAMGYAGLFGLAVGIALVAAKVALAVSVMGVTTLVTGGAALPLWIAGAAFVCTFSSTCASAADYVSKGATFIKSRSLNRVESNSEDELVKTTVAGKFHEYRGALAGVSTGLIVGIVIVAAIAIAQPHILAGIVGLVAAAMIITSCVSVLGGLFSRVGRMIDAYQFTQKKHQEALEAAQAKQTPAPHASPAPSPSRSPKPTSRNEHGILSPSPTTPPAVVAPPRSPLDSPVSVTRYEVSAAVLARSPHSGALHAPRRPSVSSLSSNDKEPFHTPSSSAVLSS
jgi:hypothetical protein